MPITPYDNSLALEEMETAYDTLLDRKIAHEKLFAAPLGMDGSRHPFILTLGGDHTIASPIRIESKKS